MGSYKASYAELQPAKSNFQQIKVNDQPAYTLPQFQEIASQQKYPQQQLQPESLKPTATNTYIASLNNQPTTTTMSYNNTLTNP